MTSTEIMATTEDQNSKKTEDQVEWSLEDELQKNEKLRKEDIDDLRNFCRILPDVDISAVTENLLVAVLHSSEYDMEKARHTATKYFEIRFSLPEIFDDRNLDTDVMQTSLDVGCYCPLPKKTPEGYRVILQSLRKKDVSLYDHLSLCKIQTITLDACVYEDPTCPGYIFVGDMQNFSIGHVWRSNFSTIKKLMRYSQEGCALKIHQLHTLNASSFSYYLMRCLKPFISKHLYDSFQFYGPDDMDEFWKVVPKECLPQDYGGYLPKLETLCQEQKEWLRIMKPKVELLPIKTK